MIYILEYQKKNFKCYTTNQLFNKSSTKHLVEITDITHGMYNTNNQIKFKTTLLKLSKRSHNCWARSRHSNNSSR